MKFNFSKLGAFLFGTKLKDKELERRESILNVILFGSICLSFLSSITAFLSEVSGNSPTGSSAGVIVFFLIFLFCYILSRRGNIKFSSYILISAYLIPTFLLSYQSGASIPQGLLIYALIIVVSGILINSKFAFFITAIISLVLILLTDLQGSGALVVKNHWTLKPATVLDGVVFGITLFIIALISWLFNRESEKTLKRARISEAALKRERDLLEVKVEKKTKELRQTQADKIAQLYRFAEFGKLASGFIHDLSNSVNLVSLNLEEIQKNDGKGLGEMRQMIRRAQIGTKSVESFISAARNQINNHEFLEYFSLNEEVNHVIEILSYKAKNAHVILYFKPEKTIKTFGNSIKFHQLVGNLLSNAIDSYDKSKKKNKIVKIELQNKSLFIELHIIDFGTGITSKNLSRIFEPFFTTKGFEKGTGIGLSISHDIVVKDFGGKITVVSKPKVGTTFLVRIPKRKSI